MMEESEKDETERAGVFRKHAESIANAYLGYKSKNGDASDLYEAEMLGHLLLSGVCWTRDAQIIINAGTKWASDPYDGSVVLVNCNDVFAWGCADTENLSEADIPELFLLWVEDAMWGPVKWVCMKRKEQPQFPIARDMKKAGVWCGRMEALEPNHYDAFLRERKAKDAIK